MSNFIPVSSSDKAFGTVMCHKDISQRERNARLPLAKTMMNVIAAMFLRFVPIDGLIILMRPNKTLTVRVLLDETHADYHTHLANTIVVWHQANKSAGLDFEIQQAKSGEMLEFKITQI